MIRKAKNTNSFSDKIADILYTAPATYDPEDDINEETKARINEYEEESDTEELTSKFRKQNIELLEDVDKRYVGKTGSRKSLQDSDEWETDDGLSTDEGEALDGIPGTRKLASSDDDENSESESDDKESNDYESADDDKDIDVSKVDDSNFRHISETNVSNQMNKGTCVRNQLGLWENLLEIRIQLQKCLISSNKMPQHDTYSDFKADANFKSSIKKTTKGISNVLEKFLSLQQLLLKQYSETKTLMKVSKKPGSDEEILCDSDNEDSEEKSEISDSESEEIPKKRRKLAEFEQEISSRYEKYKDYRNSVIQKWNEKTRLTTGKNNSVSNSVLQQINFILQDKPKLIRRAQLKRSEYDIMAKSVESNINSEENRPLNEHDTEIFDDDDFYHQLLRELIEFKSAGVTDPVQMSRQWIMLQKFRSKMKKNVDTKASKGRKVRYAVHSKLVNFMAPIDHNLWTEESKNELYSSLFGSNKI